MTSERTFYLGWQAPVSRGWYPVGRLDASADRTHYTFAYTKGALDARDREGFSPLIDFPELGKRYESEELFPLFKNRIMTPGRRDFQEYLKLLDLHEENPDPLEIMAIDGGYRATDSYQVFPKITNDADGCFKTKFFLHGWRHTNEPSKARLAQLEKDEDLFVTIELTNPKTKTAVQIQTEDYHMIGWSPDYLVHDLVNAMAHSPGDLSAKVVKINPAPAPSKQRILIELSGQWPKGYQPMKGEEFAVLPA